MRISLQKWYRSGEPWVWLNAGAVAISIVMVVGLLALIAVRGMGHFWPAAIMQANYELPGTESRLVAGEEVDHEEVPIKQLKNAGVPIIEGIETMQRTLLKVGNRDLTNADFQWVVANYLTNIEYPEEVMAIERREWGNFYGYLRAVKQDGELIAGANDAELWSIFQQRIERALTIYDDIYEIEKHDIGAINSELERLRLQQRRLELDNELTPTRLADIKAQEAELQAQYKQLEKKLAKLHVSFQRDSIVVDSVDGNTTEISLAKIVRAYKPNAMSLWQKIAFYGDKVWEFVSDDPREANTEGGIFPAIFGTVMMVILMSVMVTPFGVIAAVYLREYASQGAITRTIRIAVNNLAGVPSIVYGVFGLGFFVYFLGSNIDQLFFPEALPSPTFGTPGLLWASITLALLTLPVVIVATEEGLSRIPRAVREGSLALGATKAETLWRVVLPMASPAMMTGLILAVARAAGEVAPLMLVGVVKLAPSLPLDGNYPYLHLDQKFMHLGFHIYDVGFQSPNVEAARPLVYATALLLVIVIAVLNLSAVAIRNHLREKYKSLEV
ncbi:phosphate ABC transporter permease PstA [Spartinivicinus poritis]|uniref:Phosphate transport system permease protein PstA n=1 Tax=Spartinivicinus poritis TaxID=2994640 RepID=A0ABT5U5P1_9GAMM|nr:phosphate ABC transporter permease PstA [Spartinivicinus sp. A2-2]MDE1461679.1 phosphate ABC transporter permease PstA [Spartinivicinus sp. A2-2]